MQIPHCALHWYLRVKSSCWLFNAVGDGGSGSNLALSPMKVLPHDKGKDKNWSQLKTFGPVKNGRILAHVSPVTKWTPQCRHDRSERDCWLSHFAPFVLSSPYNVGLCCRKPRSLRLSTIFILNCHWSCWVRVSVMHFYSIRVPQKVTADALLGC